MSTIYKRVNLKAAVMAVLTEISGSEMHYLRGDFEGMIRGNYDASARLAERLQGTVLLSLGGGVEGVIHCNSRGKPVIMDNDTIRRYTHEWRRKYLKQLEFQATLAANQPGLPESLKLIDCAPLNNGDLK